MYFLCGIPYLSYRLAHHVDRLQVLPQLRYIYLHKATKVKHRGFK